MSSLGQLRNNVEQNEGLQQFSHKWVAVLLMWFETESEGDGSDGPTGWNQTWAASLEGSTAHWFVRWNYKIVAAPHWHLQSEQPGVFEISGVVDSVVWGPASLCKCLSISFLSNLEIIAPKGRPTLLHISSIAFLHCKIVFKHMKEPNLRFWISISI